MERERVADCDHSLPLPALSWGPRGARAEQCLLRGLRPLPNRRSSASSRVRTMHRACRSQVGGRTWSERLMILTRSSGAGSALGRLRHWACGVSAYGE